MMMRMLEKGGLPVLIDGIRTADEDNPNGYYEFEAVKRTKEDSSWLDDAGGKAVKMVYRLLYDLPQGHHYKVVFMRRDSDEILASQRTMMERNSTTTNDISNDEMEALFRRELQQFNEWAEKQADLSILEVNYNQVLEEPRAQLENLNTFVGGFLDVSSMVEVIDEKLYRNRAVGEASQHAG